MRPGYAEQRAALQEAIAIADTELKSYTDNSLAENLRNTFRSNLVGFSAGFTAVLGGIVAVVLGVAAPGRGDGGRQRGAGRHVRHRPGAAGRRRCRGHALLAQAETRRHQGAGSARGMPCRTAITGAWST